MAALVVLCLAIKAQGLCLKFNFLVASICTTPTRRNRRDDLSSLSTEVLRLRLQALNLPIAGNRATLLASLRRALDGRSAANAAPATPDNAVEPVVSS